jgi:hypothetical protein
MSWDERWLFILLTLMELLIITVYAFFCFVDIGGIVDHHCLYFLLFCWHWWNCWSSLFKLSFVLLTLVELLIITVYTFFCFVDIGGIVDHHCLYFLLFCWHWWNCWSSLFKLSFVLLTLVELLIITGYTFFSYKYWIGCTYLVICLQEFVCEKKNWRKNCYTTLRQSV